MVKTQSCGNEFWGQSRPLVALHLARTCTSACLISSFAQHIPTGTESHTIAVTLNARSNGGMLNSRVQMFLTRPIDKFKKRGRAKLQFVDFFEKF